MNLEKEFINRMLSCDWLMKCGMKDTFEFDVYYLDSVNEVAEHINSLKWENVCLDQMGDFTAYLSINYPDEYNNYWNEQVYTVKEKYVSVIEKKIEKNMLRLNLPNSILEDMKMNILSLFMLNYYSEYYESDFYQTMHEIYMKGHLPCGWVEGCSHGRFLVF